MHNDTFERLPLADAELWLQRGFLSANEAAAYFDRLLHELKWGQGSAVLFGRTYKIPRLQAWCGDPDTQYTYSGMRLTAAPWTATLSELKSRIARAIDAPFNSVLANLYRDGGDGVGWHSDDERDLGIDPVIGSLSLGATRRFQLRHRTRRDLPIVNLDLEHGSLLIMAGQMQTHWRHQIPKTKAPVGARINLTFRRVRASAVASDHTQRPGSQESSTQLN